MQTNRRRLENALRGEAISHPSYVVYDAFLPNPTVDWDYLFSLGLGQVNHVFVVDERHPHCEIVETISREGGLERKDVSIRTAQGELHCRIMAAALEGSSYETNDRAFRESEDAPGENGITIAHVDRT